jgi:hypothetical protein
MTRSFIQLEQEGQGVRDVRAWFDKKVADGSIYIIQPLTYDRVVMAHLMHLDEQQELRR